MGKANCPFCNSRNTFNIAYGYLGKKKKKKNYIEQEDIGLNESYRKGFEKYDFDGEKLISHLPNRYCKDCKNTFQSRKVMYTVDISVINLIINIGDDYYRYIFDFSDMNNPKYTIKINWIPIKENISLCIKDRNKILYSFKEYKPNLWHGHYGKNYNYNKYYWILKCTYYNGVDYVKSGNDKVPDDWDYSLAGLLANSKEKITSLKSALNELKQNGYLSVIKLNPNQTKSKKYEYIYNIYEEPHLEPYIQKQDIENLDIDFQDFENHTQQSTNKQNIKKQTDKEDKTQNNIFDVHNFLTIDLIDRKYITKDDTDIYNYDKLFKNLLNEYDTSDILMILHYIIPRVLDRDFVDENGEKIVNKFGYLKNSILNNIIKLKNNDLLWDEELGWFKDNEEDIEEEIEI